MTRTIDLQRRDLERLLDFYDKQRDFVAEQQAGYVRAIPTPFTKAALEKFAKKQARGGVLLSRLRVSTAAARRQAECVA